MTDPSSMPSQDPALESFREDVLEAGHEESLDNTRRGCGHLDHNACYVRSDVNHLSSERGEIPRFVVLDDPVEFREYGDRGAIIRGYRKFPGVQFGMAYVNDGRETTPEDAIPNHHRRMRETLRFDGSHLGEITAGHSHDILMSVGKSHWPDPEDYIEECRQLGLNLKIGSGPNSPPPTINPMQTRCWVVHPHGYGEGRAGVIGYGVLTRAVYTTGPDSTANDPDIPQYAKEWYQTGKVDLATPGEELDPEEGESKRENQALAAFEENND